LSGNRFRRRLSPGIWAGFFLAIASLDLVGIDLQSFSGRQIESVLAEGQAAAAYLADQPGRFRIYSPSYSIPGQTAVNYRLEQLDGVDPLQLELLAEFMEGASGVPRAGYSVTLPPFATGTPAMDNRAYLPDPRQLGLLNVAYVVSESDLPVEGLVVQARFGEKRIYKNTFARPRAWVQDAGEKSQAETSQPARITTWTPNEIRLTATGPGILVLSEIAYPGWQAWIDGERREIQVAEGLLRGLTLGAGEHTVVYEYRPGSLYAGLVLCSAAVLFLASRRIFRKDSRPNREEGED
jgi:hypothetical protein